MDRADRNFKAIFAPALGSAPRSYLDSALNLVPLPAPAGKLAGFGGHQ
jgi:hypothetical protein